MSYLVLARRFRPQTFEDLIGQEHVTQTLQNAITSDRVAHAFLFSGARGVGKTTAARVLAKALNCVNGPTTTPCGKCEQCKGIAESRAVDVQEIDGASNNSVDDVRALRETIPYQPSSGRFKIYIVDEVHMLSGSAFNALLKTLEEPPPHVKFIFATTESHKIPVTILSRCQRYDFRLIPTAQIMERLAYILEQEGVEAERAAISLLASEAQGSMRDSLSLLDQVLAFDSERLESQRVAQLLGVADRQLLFEISRALLSSDATAALRAVENAATFGSDLIRLSHDVLRHLRNLVVAAQCPNDDDLIDISREELAELRSQVDGHEVAEMHRLFLLFSKAVEEIARASQPRLVLEMTLARMASLEPMRSLEMLARQLESLATSGSQRLPLPTRSAPEGGIRRSAPAKKTPEGTIQRSAPAKKTPEGTIQRSAPAKKTPEGGIQRSAPAQKQGSSTEGQARGQQQTLGGGAGGRTGSSTLPTEIKEAWKALLAHIEASSPPLYHLLRQARPLELSKSKVRLRLPDQPFYRGEAQNPLRLKALKAACETVLSSDDVLVEFEVSGEGGGANRGHIEHAAREHDKRREATEHTMVRAALAEFEGAKIESVQLQDDKKK